MKKTATLLIALTCSLLALHAEEPRISLSEKGIVIEKDGLGILTLEAPVLHLDSGKSEKPAFDVSGERAVAKYPGGTELQVELQNGEVTVRYASVPPDAKALMFAMNIPVSFSQGGKFAFGKGDLKEFPAEKGEKFVQNGVGEGKLVLAAPGDSTLVVETPTNWIAMQDNRVFGMNNFSWQFLYDLRARAGKDSLTIRFSDKE